MSDCYCEICSRQRQWRSAIFSEDLELKEEAFSQMLDSLYDLEMDIDYNAAVIDGSWPGSIQVLERRIEKLQKVLDEQRSRLTEPL